jgi:hypothetical protein
MTLDYKNVGKVAKKLHCKNCDYITSNKYNYTKHLLTAKHKRNDAGLQNDDILCMNVVKSSHICGCGMIYKYRQGLYKHKKNCVKKDKNYLEELEKSIDEISEKELIMMLIKQNTKLIEQNSELTKNNSITNNCNITNNNSHNKTFNLQFFLNETCKNAMNITDFVQNIQLQISDLEDTGRLGYVTGISNIILKNLNNLETHFRPMHCSDLKREILYIKNDNQWVKETDDKPILTKAIKMIANENIKQINEFKKLYPDCREYDSKKNDLYLNIISNSMSGSTKEESDKNINKIISKLVKEVVIEK